VLSGLSGHEITDAGAGDLSMHPPSEQMKGSGDLSIHPPSPIIECSENSAAKESPQQHDHLRILIDWEELSDKMADLHYKDIKNFWLCGRIENGKLLDIALEREVQ
jgi:hypothetical protein